MKNASLLHSPEKLPIDAALADIIEKLRSSGAIVIKAEPGAGKTTRVPAAILDAGLACMETERSASHDWGQIVVLQPRRVAARSAAMRVAEERPTELGKELGKEIGYQVRQEGRHSQDTRILFCTEGIFLRRLQDDPLLEETAVVVFDEFHERSIDSDLALAMVRQVRAAVRPDLKIVVMSATLDPEPVSRYLGGCPTVVCPGRTFPIAIEYLKFPPSAQLPQLAIDGVRQMVSQTDGHVLVFLPGVGEIRKCESLLLDDAGLRTGDNLQIMTLYGDMPLAEQQLALQPIAHRKIILATNVAETSLTIDGVTTVVDSGVARVNRFHPQLGLNRLELERISRASADQRAGRAGRTGPGRCLRLWTERDQQALREFETPEISRVDLSQCLLQLIAWGEPDVRRFEWFEFPPASAVERALQLLQLIDALDGASAVADLARLTELGKRMARLPLQPRLARLLIEGRERAVAARASLCAALLSERDPFVRDTASPSADDRRSQERYHRRTDSDLLDRVGVLEEFGSSGARHFAVGTLAAGSAKQVIRSAEDLIRLVGGEVSSATTAGGAPGDQRGATGAPADEAVLRAIAAAFPDRVCRRRAPRDKRALMVGGRGVRLADESGVSDCELFVAVELSDTGQSETLVRQASHIDRSWLPESHVTTTIDVAYDIDKRKVTALKRTRYVDLILEETQVPVPADIDAASVLSRGIAEHIDAATLLDDQAKNYIARIDCLRQWIPELELPDFGGSAPWNLFLPEWCLGCTGVSELTGDSLIALIKSKLTRAQTTAIEEEAPERMMVPSGRQHKLIYERGKPPVLAVRIQELFGLSETPRIARNRISVLLHLLAPNYRVQQITPDLASFWKSTYPQVRKDLKARYPKHAWPDNPLIQPPKTQPPKTQPPKTQPPKTQPPKK